MFKPKKIEDVKPGDTVLYNGQETFVERTKQDVLPGMTELKLETKTSTVWWMSEGTVLTK